MGESFKKISFVVGPTASGKSAWAMTEAKKSGGAIVNADSVQIYLGMDIGTAKPSREDQSQVPHMLFDIIKPNHVYTAGDYRRAALQLIEKKLKKQPLFFVGGSGFYLQALELGMFNVGPIDEEIKAQVEKWKEAGELYAQLQKLDPESAKNISPSDEYRQIRALEVTLSEDRPISEIQKEFAAAQKKNRLGEQYPLQKIGIAVERDVLRKRIERRTENMLAKGLIDEVKGLLEKGYGNTKAFGSIGYREVADFLIGRISESEIVPAIVTSSMQLAKRQMTWFKRDKEIVWYKSHGVDEITFSNS